MASKREQEAQDLASETRRNAACAKIVIPTDSDPHTPEYARDITVDVFGALIEAIEGERDDITELRRKGWQSRAREHDAAIAVTKEWRDLVAGHKPPAGMPTREPLTEIAVSHRADTPAELDARLEAAFAIPTPVRHIRTTLEFTRTTEGEEATKYGALCGGQDGSWTHRGGANCETCIATHDAEHGPYAGPVAFSEATGAGGQVVTTGMGFMPVDVSGQSGEEGASLIENTWPIEARSTDAMHPGGTYGMDTSALERINALPDASGTLSGTFNAAPPGETVVNLGTATIEPMQTERLHNNNGPDLIIVEPTGPRVRPRMSAAQVREHGLARQRGAEHRSVSQVESFGDCGTRAALSDLERPAWWNVGGKALHACIEEINRHVAELNGRAMPTLDNAEGLWLRHFDQQIAEQHAATPDHPMSTWRAAKKGSEHYDFWRVEGPIMVQRWVTWLTRMLAEGWQIAQTTQVLGVGSLPIIEYSTHLDVGIPVPNLSIIDLALLHAQRNTLLVVDAKAGGSAPKDTFQLGVYGWSLLAAGIAGFTPTPDLSNVRGAYWRARTGETHVANLPILSMHPWPDVVQRYRDMDVMERQGVYMPNVTSFCGGCGVRDLCPAQASS